MTELRQVWLGVKPYVLIELTDPVLNDAGDLIGLSTEITYGGGTQREDLLTVIGIAADQLRDEAVAHGD